MATGNAALFGIETTGRNFASLYGEVFNSP